ncbi:GGDEF domain-containing protein [Mycolicibacterium moriokaense]|nr:GGDEF domain-containing protein [Mycolicibacterium moriokaense]
MGWLREWWVQPDHYRWLSGYLGYRNVRVFTRRMMAAVVLALGVVPLLTAWTPVGPTSTFGRAISALVIICCAVMAAMWFSRWPSRQQSVAFVLTSNACLAVACLVYSTPGMSLLGCTAFAALAGYVAFFHTSRFLALVLTTAAATSIWCALELAENESPLVAVAKLLIIAVGVLAVPFSVHVLVHLLGDDALKSHTDPLTGLRNRRGFYRSLRELTDGSGWVAEPYLSVIMIDLDRFKQVNDTRGHTTGDRILIAVADRLRRATHGRAVVARVGGEEFLIAEMTLPGEALANAERLRQEVASIPLGATASVGVACVSWAEAAAVDTRTLIDRLIDAADGAMYEAKRAGGNQTRPAEGTPIHST